MKKYKYDLLIDIDNVVRDLDSIISKALGHKARSWDEGRIVFDLIRRYPEILLRCKTTKYYKTILNRIKYPRFISHQMGSWQVLTMHWLRRKFKNCTYIFVAEAKDKMKFFKEAKYVIEDNPNYDDYGNIILIDALYNRNVKNPLVRIKTVKQLNEFLIERNIT